MEIYLIRHTQTATVLGLCYGQFDVPLADNFLQEVDIIRKKLPEIESDWFIYSSPLRRCKQLAEKFSEQIVIDERLQELNFGDWENVFFDDISAELLKNWTDNFVTVSPPNGESFEALFQRVESFWLDLLASKKKKIIIVTHAGVIRGLLANVLNLPLERAFQFSVDYGSVHKLEFQDNYTYIRYLNA